jgi:integrase
MRLAPIRRRKRLGISKECFVEYNKKPVAEVNKGFGVAMRDAELTATSHSFRHTCAAWLMQRGARTWDAANYLSMSEKILLSTYGHWRPDYQSGIAGGRKKERAAPELHDIFSVHYHRDVNLKMARKHRAGRQAARAASAAAA